MIKNQENLNNVLKDFEQILVAKQIPAHNFLSRGADIISINNFFKKQYGLDASMFNLKQLFLWHNGVEDNIKEGSSQEKINMDNTSIIPDYTLLSIEQIVFIINNRDINAVFKFKENRLLPIMNCYNGEFLAINLDEYIQSPEKASIYYCQVWDGESNMYESMYDNLSLMFKTYIELYKKNIFFYQNNELDMDFDKYYEISGQLNPNAQYWKKE